MKLHFDKSGVPACRPELTKRTKAESYNLTTEIPKITCKHCMKALGLNTIRLAMSAKIAKLTLYFPDGKSVEVPAENFEMKIQQSPALGIEDVPPIGYKEFLMPEPEPITFSMKMTEEGRDSLMEAIYSMPLRA